MSFWDKKDAKNCFKNYSTLNEKPNIKHLKT